jgi:hypothetical protein
MKKLRLNFHLLQPHVVPFTRLHANANSEKAKAPPPGAHLQDFLAGKKYLFFGSDGTFERSESIIKS